MAVQYFGSFGVANLTTSADHLVITFRASSSQVESLFHNRIDSFSLGRQTYFAPVGPVQVPAPLAGAISSVEGLSSYASYLFHPLGGHSNPIFRTPPASNHPPPSRAQGFLEPATVNGVQLEFAPDFQVSYDELSLFAEAGFPTSAVIATILVGGCSGSYDSTGACPSGEIIAPWNPNDIYSYYNETLPSGEPHAAAYGVNLFGAVAPGTSAQYDQSGAVGENTLDLEMAGSTAPAASLYNVYGP